MYEILFSEQAKKQLVALHADTRERIGYALERIKIRPYQFVKRLYNSKYYRLRIDDYRVILNILNNQLIIYVIKVGHRSEIYN